MKNASYCYVHSLVHWKRVPFYRSAALHTVLVGLVFPLLLFYLSGIDIKREGKATRDVVTESNRQLLDEIRRLSESMEDELSKYYVSGFILFGVKRTELVVPSGSRIGADWRFDWSQSAITELTESGFCMRCPDITYIPSQSDIRGVSICFQLSDPVGKVVPFPLELGLPENIYIEILERNAQGWIFVMGFIPKEVDSPN